MWFPINNGNKKKDPETIYTLSHVIYFTWILGVKIVAVNSTSKYALPANFLTFFITRFISI